MLHLYFLTVRFRNFGTIKQNHWEQHLVDHFFWDAEEKMIKNHRMEARGTRNKYLKDMFEQWRGLILAYDEGLARGDAVLAAAVWRNVFKADENVDIEALTMIVSWMRGTLHDLDKLRDEEITLGGELHFGSPKGELELVSLKSRMMELPFDRAPGKDLPGSRGGR
jgi:cytochrome b pre-mRNA-processing protein 3